jgi:hypothetical protein
MAKTTAEVRSADTFVRVGASAPAAQQGPAPAAFRASSLTEAPITGAHRSEAHLVLAQVRAGGPTGMPAAQMRPTPSPTAGAYRGGGFTGGYRPAVPSYNYAPAYTTPQYGYAQPSYGYAQPAYGYAQPGYGNTGGGILGWLFGNGAQISATVGPNGLTVGATTGQQLYMQQQTPAQADCIVQDGYGRPWAVRYGQMIPAGYQVVMYNPDLWTWWSTNNLY